MVLGSRGGGRSRGRGERRGSFPRGRGRSYRGGGSSRYGQEGEIFSKLSKFGSRDSEMAMEIVNAVLAVKSGERDDYGPPSKSRRLERGRGSSSYRGGSRGGHSRSYPYREEGSRKRARSEDRDDRSDRDESSKSDFEIPPEVLFCRVCNKYEFKSKRAYLKHRDGHNHKEMGGIYHHRNISVLRLMRGHAKVQSIRNDYMEACKICHGTYDKSHENEHKKSITHQIVENFLKWNCCGKFFNNRQEYDDHILTPVHLLNKYKELEEWKKVEQDTRKNNSLSDDKTKLEDYCEIADKELENFKTTKKDLMDKFEEDEDETPSELPEYDPEKPVGLKYITGEKVFRCKACVVEITADKIDDIKFHLHSPDHYFEVLRQVRRKYLEKKAKSKIVISDSADKKSDKKTKTKDSQEKEKQKEDDKTKNKGESEKESTADDKEDEEHNEEGEGEYNEEGDGNYDEEGEGEYEEECEGEGEYNEDGEGEYEDDGEYNEDGEDEYQEVDQAGEGEGEEDLENEEQTDGDAEMEEK